MAMQEFICPSCGAINQMIADACWRCLESFAGRSAAAAEIAEPLPDARPATA
jgi:predicted amidophosphoribosyltransferase